MKIFAFILPLLFVLKLNAQDAETNKDWSYPEKFRLVGINMSPLLVQLIPFNKTNPTLVGPYFVDFNRFKGQRSFHTSFGFLISTDNNFDFLDNANLNFRIGTSRQRIISDRWNFYSGFDFYLALGSFNLIGDNRNDASVIGLGPKWQVEYRINKFISTSVETAMVLGADLTFGDPELRFLPPVALNLNMVLPRKFGHY